MDSSGSFNWKRVGSNSRARVDSENSSQNPRSREVPDRELREAPCAISPSLALPRILSHTLCSPAVYAPRRELPYKSTIAGVNRAGAISPDAVARFSDNLCRRV